MCSTPRIRLKPRPLNEPLGLLSEMNSEQIARFNACADAAIEQRERRLKQHTQEFSPKQKEGS